MYLPPSPPSFPQSLTKGLTNLKDASLYMIIGTALIGISLTLFLVTFASFSLAGILSLRLNIITLLGISSFILILLVISGGIIALMAVYNKLIPGAKDLSDYDPELTSAAMLIKIGYVWGLILAIIGVVTLIIIIGVFLIIIALIFLLVGEIGLIIMLFKLNSSLKETMFMVAGILFIIGLFLPIVSFIGWILVYVAANSILIRSKQPHYSLGQGIKTPPGIIQCPYCGSQIPAGSKRCPVCGLELPSSS